MDFRKEEMKELIVSRFGASGEDMPMIVSYSRYQIVN